MTVSELITQLNGRDPNAEVVVGVGVFGSLKINSAYCINDFDEGEPKYPVYLRTVLDDDLSYEQAHAIVDAQIGIGAREDNPTQADAI